MTVGNTRRFPIPNCYNLLCELAIRPEDSKNTIRRMVQGRICLVRLKCHMGRSREMQQIPFLPQPRPQGNPVISSQPDEMPQSDKSRKTNTVSAAEPFLQCGICNGGYFFAMIKNISHMPAAVPAIVHPADWETNDCDDKGDGYFKVPSLQPPDYRLILNQ